ncbi:MAG: hypothetical protein P5702_01670 [Limnospira sp. PMC 1291.21]|uniref:Uncharacterized protein n=2 Tax=Limnospira TaxID=2596745 RepID=B5VZ29_LIMMA|nr:MULTISPECIES: hypothetical protein [Limnospira]EKD10099.1 hypothetical protein SPLC1_S101290 [Arthrospira platensis C1]MDC0840595.1 hypothetical protein [Limnoraphis robusta]MDT9182406.1 hypothetical protein [Limnospira sp. PMC 289.06]MDY7052011.1 hypothetical protein [Limnospira fusiformis LS22]QJB28517.1 hypothetical protein HFV01_25360 [Limnospira fusiformis SAG 85.79]
MNRKSQQYPRNLPRIQPPNADEYLQKMTPEVLASFNPQQLAEIRQTLDAAIPQPSSKIVDLRFTVDLIIDRFYVVVFVGKERRQKKRSPFFTQAHKIANIIAASLLLIGLNLMISAIIFLLLYLIKSALGIDLFPGEHLIDILPIN